MSFLDIRHGTRITVHVKFICQIQTESRSGFYMARYCAEYTKRSPLVCEIYGKSGTSVQDERIV